MGADVPSEAATVPDSLVGATVVDDSQFDEVEAMVDDSQFDKEEEALVQVDTCVAAAAYGPANSADSSAGAPGSQDGPRHFGQVEFEQSMLVVQAWSVKMNELEFAGKIVTDMEAWVVAATMIVFQAVFDLALAEAMMAQFVEFRQVYMKWQALDEVVDVDAKRRRINQKAPE